MERPDTSDSPQVHPLQEKVARALDAMLAAYEGMSAPTRAQLSSSLKKIQDEIHRLEVNAVYLNVVNTLIQRLPSCITDWSREHGDIAKMLAELLCDLKVLWGNRDIKKLPQDVRLKIKVKVSDVYGALLKKEENVKGEQIVKQDIENNRKKYKESSKSAFKEVCRNITERFGSGILSKDQATEILDALEPLLTMFDENMFYTSFGRVCKRLQRYVDSTEVPQVRFDQISEAVDVLKDNPEFSTGHIYNLKKIIRRLQLILVSEINS